MKRFLNFESFFFIFFSGPNFSQGGTSPKAQEKQETKLTGFIQRA